MKEFEKLIVYTAETVEGGVFPLDLAAISRVVFLVYLDHMARVRRMSKTEHNRIAKLIEAI